MSMDPYSQKTSFTIAQGCPWYEAQQSYGVANVNWCEPSRCSVFDEPANTWSNLVFLFAFIYLFKKFQDKFLRLYAVTLLVVGLFSFIYHASNNAFSQLFDFVGMYLMTSIILAFNTSRTLFPKSNINAQFWFFSFFNMLLYLCCGFLNIPIQWTMILNFLLILSLEIYNGFKEKSFRHYKFLLVSFFIFTFAQSAAMIDLKRVYCKPDNIILHGHVIWHIFAAIGLVFIGLHMNIIRKMKKA